MLLEKEFNMMDSFLKAFSGGMFRVLQTK